MFMQGKQQKISKTDAYVLDCSSPIPSLQLQGTLKKLTASTLAR